MKISDPEATPYVLGTSLMAVLFIAGMIRLWLLRRVEEKLLKNKDALEKQVLAQQKDLQLVRSDANAWRAEMQRQFDLYRHMASDQLKVEESRFDNLLLKSREREQALQTTLDITRQMCAELPTAKARLMQLEALLGIDAGEGLPANTIPTGDLSGDLSPLPDLHGNGSSAPAESVSASIPEPTTMVAAGVGGSSHEIETLRQQNMALQQALTAERLRARIKERASNGSKTKSRR